MSRFETIKKQSQYQHTTINTMDAKDLTKEYSNGEVTIVWKNSLCKHAAECVKNNPDVFKPKERPWIVPENSTTEAIISTVKKCPSGALTYYINKE